MKVIEAEKIINEYGKNIAEAKNEIVHPISRLQYPKEQIIKAYELYVKALIELDMLNEDTENKLCMTYGELALFIDDDEASEINILQYKNKKILAEKYLELNKIKMEKITELEDYIKKCKKNKGSYPELVNEYIEQFMKQYTPKTEKNKSFKINEIISKTIAIGIVVVITYYLLISFFGTEEIGAPFNKPNFETVYYVNIYDSKTSDNPITTQKAWLNVKSGHIYLSYIYFDNKYELDFWNDYELEMYKKIPVKFYFYDSNKTYDWYVELTDRKVLEN